MSLFAKLAQLVDSLPTKQPKPTKAPVQPSTFGYAQPSMNMGAMSIFDLIRPPQQPQFDVTAASGTKPKNYRPVQVGMSGLPAPSVFALLGDSALPQNVFTVTPASGTKPKNYRPTQIDMNAPSIAGPQAMQQMLAMMQATRSPFAPFGQG